MVDKPVTFHAKIKSSGTLRPKHLTLRLAPLRKKKKKKKKRIASSKLQRIGSSNVVAQRLQLFLLRSFAPTLLTVPPCMCTRSTMTVPGAIQMLLSLHCIACDSVRTARGWLPSSHCAVTTLKTPLSGSRATAPSTYHTIGPSLR